MLLRQKLVLLVVAICGVGYALAPPTPQAPQRQSIAPSKTELIQGVGVLQAGYVMCLSEKALSEAHSLVRARKFDMLESIGCYKTSRQLDGVVVDYGFMTSGVRIHVPGTGSALVYVPTEALGRRSVQ
jgi:hypothetical protein